MDTARSLPDRFNVADHFILPHLTPERIDRPYLYCGEEVLTFGALHERTNRVGNLLRRLGVEPEQRVMLLMQESLSFPPCFWGAVRIGAVAVPLNTVLLPSDYAHYVNDSRARVLIVDAALWPKIAPVEASLRRLGHILIAEGSVPGKPALDDLLAAEPTVLESEAMTPDVPAFWLYTSGSTGAPKAAVHLHHDMVVVAERYMKGVLRLRPGDLTFSAPKFFFAYGLGNSLYGPLSAGSSAVIQREPATAENCLRLLARHRPVIFYAVPTLVNAMLALYEGWLHGEGDPLQRLQPLPRLEHLRFAISAGENLPLELARRWERHFGSPLLDGIGSTELLHFYIINRPGQHRPGSTGVPVPGYVARLVDEAGRPVPDGEVGELLVKGDSAAAGYWNRQALTRAVFRGEWVATGDRFQRDADGFYWYQGRSDDMLKVGGSWVSPAEVEDALLSHCAVAECAVVGRVDADDLVKGCACVVLRPGHAPSAELGEALRAHAGQRLAAFKVPRWVRFVPELPKTASGKVRRFLLREAEPLRRPA